MENEVGYRRGTGLNRGTMQSMRMRTARLSDGASADSAREGGGPARFRSKPHAAVWRRCAPPPQALPPSARSHGCPHPRIHPQSHTLPPTHSNPTPPHPLPPSYQ